MKKNRFVRNQKGFTLIEIIAVLIILGILAAIAIPKYFDMTADAKNKSAQAAVAEGIARLNAKAAQYIIQNNGALPLASALTVENDAGDYTLTLSGATTSTVLVTATGKAGTPAESGTATRTWTRPS